MRNECLQLNIAGRTLQAVQYVGIAEYSDEYSFIFSEFREVSSNGSVCNFDNYTTRRFGGSVTSLHFRRCVIPGFPSDSWTRCLPKACVKTEESLLLYQGANCNSSVGFSFPKRLWDWCKSEKFCWPGTPKLMLDVQKGGWEIAALIERRIANHHSGKQSGIEEATDIKSCFVLFYWITEPFLDYFGVLLICLRRNCSFAVRYSPFSCQKLHFEHTKIMVQCTFCVLPTLPAGEWFLM